MHWSLRLMETRGAKKLLKLEGTDPSLNWRSAPWQPGLTSIRQPPVRGCRTVTSGLRHKQNRHPLVRSVDGASRAVFCVNKNSSIQLNFLPNW
jgi:hypothetical protein